MSDYKLGPAYISFKGSDLGKTQGGVTLSITESTVTLNTDQDGETPVDEQITGTTVSVSGNLAENTLDNIATMLKQTKQTSGGKEKVEITTNVGTSLKDEGGKLIIKPYEGGTVVTDQNEWVTIHNAGMKAESELAYNSSDQRVIAFTATGYADSNGKVATFGDTTI